MGDMGSMVLGFCWLCWPSSSISRCPATADRHLDGAVIVLGLPIFDTTLVVFTRLRERRSPMQGGKDHTSHRLVSLGLSQRVAVLVLYGVCVMLGLVAISLPDASIDSGLQTGFALAVGALGAFVFLEYVYIRSKQH